ncbi:MAG TPA: hypothetical protein VH763_15200 [Gemmatimonadales bacterium]|jgi:hypothetical protein
MDTNLTYYIAEGVLAGVVGNRMFHVLALSGGGGGSTRAAPDEPENPYQLDNPYDEPWLPQPGPPAPNGHVHGGPVPPGKYSIHTPSHHPHLGLSARLIHPSWKPIGRDGFFIHSRGPHGSDGCIVPLDAGKFRELMSALTDSKGGTLFVKENMRDTGLA